MVAASRLSRDKSFLDQIISSDQNATELSRLRPKSKVVTGLELLTYMLNKTLAQNESFVVVKPVDGQGGNNVFVLGPNNLNAGYPFDLVEHNQKYLIEDFIPSKPVPAKDGKCYDGCARYVCVYEKFKGKVPTIRHFGGYWRLAQKPISDYGCDKAMLANLSKNATAHPLSKKEQDKMQTTAERLATVLGTRFSRLARSMSPHIALDLKSTEY